MKSKTATEAAQKKQTAKMEVPENVDTEKDSLLAIEVPRNGFSVEALENLRKIIVSKETLIKKALGADNLPIVMKDDKLNFPWFVVTGDDGETDAYTRLICAICEMAKRQKRVVAKEREVENDKFTMRLFLIRLGFIGDEYKEARRILLKNLTGNGSFKNGQRPKKVVPAVNDNVSTSTDDGKATSGDSETTPTPEM